MPVYTYRCENCGIQFEANQKFTDSPLTRCPECGKKSLRKVYQPVGIIFKGSGFYATDNRSPSGASRFNSHGENKASEEKSTDNKPAESKPADSKPASDSNSSSGSKPSSSDQK